MKPAILVLTSTYPRWEGDIEPAFVHDLSRRLLDDYQVHVLAPHFAGAAPAEEMEGVSVHRFRYCFAAAERLAYAGGMLFNIRTRPWLLLLLPVFLLAQWWSALRLIRRHDIRLVHAHWVIPQGVVAWAIKLFKPGIPLVVTSHGGDVYGLRGGLLGWLKKRVYRAADQVTVVSHAMASDMRHQLDLQNLQVAPMGVDLQEGFVAATPQEDRKGIVFVGRLVEKKGVGVLLEALALLRSTHAAARLSIVGHGPDREPLESQAEALGIADAVDFLGPVPNHEVPKILNCHAIAVVPSVVAASGDQEGLGLVTIEAMGCGCAVIASDLPAIRDVVTHESTGLMFAPGDAGELAGCLACLLEDEAHRRRLAEAGRDSVLQEFDWERAAGRYREIFAGLISGQAVSGSRPSPG